MTRLEPCLALTLWFGILALPHAETAGQREARVRPPAAVKCDRNRHHLTAFMGVVLKYVRGTDRTTIQIRTDWETTEQVAIDHKASDPSRWFLYRGQPFTVSDWEKI